MEKPLKELAVAPRALEPSLPVSRIMRNDQRRGLGIDFCERCELVHNARTLRRVERNPVSEVLDSFTSWADAFPQRPCQEDDVGPCEAAGYVASGLVVMAFCMKDLMHLRIIALASNVAFLIYGLGLDLVPVWALHAILLPVNICRLWQELSGRTRQMRPCPAGPKPERARA